MTLDFDFSISNSEAFISITSWLFRPQLFLCQTIHHLSSVISGFTRCDQSLRLGGKLYGLFWGVQNTSILLPTISSGIFSVYVCVTCTSRHLATKRYADLSYWSHCGHRRQSRPDYPCWTFHAYVYTLWKSRLQYRNAYRKLKICLFSNLTAWPLVKFGPGYTSFYRGPVSKLLIAMCNLR